MEMAFKKTSYKFLYSLSKCIVNRSYTRNTKKCADIFPKKYYSTEGQEPKEHQVPVENIRNFSIIAHIDHGKSTLADRLLEMTGAIKANSGHQVLDKLQVEKERGITVKAQTASLKYIYKDTEYLLNLIDTPGHVDFATEVHRSLAPCQGVILLIDANEGVQAQTVANFYLAFGRDLVIIPVMNKVDLKNANPERVSKQLTALFEFENSEILRISAKLGTGVEKVLQAVIEKIPPPPVLRDKPLKALIFDSWFDKYKDIKTLYAGQVGCLACNMRSSAEAHIGDTLHLKSIPVEPFTKFEPAKPMVFAGVYPMDQSQHVALRGAIEKLILNDSAVTACMESSPALGQGWRLGFLGMLHMEVFSQRLEQEYGAEAIVTAPGVTYKAKMLGTKNIKQYGEEFIFNNPTHFPGTQIVEQYYEPIVLGTIITPDKYLGAVMSLCLERRGVQQSSQNIDNERIMLQYILPLNEIIVDFHDTLKSMSSGYASFDYENQGWVPSEIVKVEIHLNGTLVEELSTIVHCSRAREMGKRMCAKLVEIIPRQQFVIAIQAKVGAKILARETLKAFRKDVTAKLYGGDVTRRMKLLAKQAAGKRRMRMVGTIPLPRETFIDVLKK
ncbi:translation factor GUF1 homolog, mitochondrial isoform X2 [Venturia canescens]|uniref:translation factor GUF1 homolog, mitochondrial isoform X2 n=1 Tax=Venturia canescens TaxID=32260 RepID=UPI001C9CF7E3|nr:translation factor GUF1 homolog, mitochondrial isoform X2 [Venturia canescens]